MGLSCFGFAIARYLKGIDMGKSWREMTTPRGPGASKLEEMGCGYEDDPTESGFDRSKPSSWGNQGPDKTSNWKYDGDSGKGD